MNCSGRAGTVNNPEETADVDALLEVFVAL